MVQMVFEDKKEAPISVLLRSCYNGKNLHFAGGEEQSKNELVMIDEEGEKRECSTFL